MTATLKTTPSTAPLHIILDTREHELISLFNSRPTTAVPISWSTSSLPLGDVLFVKGHPDGRTEEVLLVERKAVADLAGSIQDGRYNEQSLRLHHYPIHNHNIIYIIEGNISTYHSRYSRVDAGALHSAVFSLLFYKGFSTIHTVNIQQTYEWIVRAYSKIIKEQEKKDGKIPFYGGGGMLSMTELATASAGASSKMTIPETDPGTELATAISTATPIDHPNVPTAYTDVLIKKVKNQNITPENIAVILLSQIPGISSTNAEIMMRGFSSISEFIAHIQADPDYLSAITYTTKGGQTRHIPKNVVENVRRFLLHEG
jgi:ERCC4-type nuclease